MESALARENQRKKKDTQLRVWNGAKVTGLFLLMLLLAIILMFPYVFMVNKSLMTQQMVIDPTVPFFPDWGNLAWSNYVDLFRARAGATSYGAALGNTMIIVCFNVIAVPISASMAAFAFSKLHFKGRGVVFALMMMTIMLPGIVTQIPLYVIYAKIGWLDTLLPFTIPNLFGGGALYIFLIRQYMMGIPDELVDAAKVDGCGYFRIYWQIILPNCKTILIYVMIQVFLAYWGDYYGPLLYLTSSDAPYTFAYVLFKNSVESDAATDMAGIRMAGGVFMTILPTILFIVFQNELTDGNITSGIKG